MEEFKLFDGEYKFLNIIWEREPVGSTDLVKLCAERLGWKKSTTYTMLRRLGERGIVKNENATVKSLIGREQVRKFESETLLRKSFDGSLPAFLASFLRDRKLTPEEAGELHRMIRAASAPDFDRGDGG